jgi:hypothetical protein
MFFGKLSAIWVVAVAVEMVVIGVAKGDIVNGVENFSGTTIDTSTYQVIN